MQTHSISKVLLIDDDPVFGRMLSTYGDERAMQIEYFSTLIDAVYACDLREFDVAVIDCVMPGIDGFELAEYFRAFHKDLPVVLVSHARRQDSDERSRKVGATVFVAKNLGLNAILDTVQQVA